MAQVTERGVGLGRRIEEPAPAHIITDIVPIVESDLLRPPPKQTPVPIPDYAKASSVTRTLPKPPAIAQPRVNVPPMQAQPPTPPKRTPINPPAALQQRSLVSHPSIQKLQKSWYEEQRNNTSSSAPVSPSQNGVTLSDRQSSSVVKQSLPSRLDNARPEELLDDAALPSQDELEESYGETTEEGSVIEP